MIIEYSDMYTPNKSMKKLSKGGIENLDLINYFISKGADDWNGGLYAATERGDNDLINFFIDKGARDWNYLDLKNILELSDRELLLFCRMESYHNRECFNEKLWKKRVINRYGKIEKNPNRSWKNFYLDTIIYSDKYTPDKAISILSESGMENLDLINFL